MNVNGWERLGAVKIRGAAGLGGAVGETPGDGAAAGKKKAAEWAPGGIGWNRVGLGGEKSGALWITGTGRARRAER